MAKGTIHNGRIGIGFYCADCTDYTLLPEGEIDLADLHRVIDMLHSHTPDPPPCKHPRAKVKRDSPSSEFGLVVCPDCGYQRECERLDD